MITGRRIEGDPKIQLFHKFGKIVMKVDDQEWLISPELARDLGDAMYRLGADSRARNE